MYETKSHTARFNTETQDDLEQYDSILENPLCTVTDKWREKIQHSDYDDGKLASVRTELWLVVSWTEKHLL